MKKQIKKDCVSFRRFDDAYEWISLRIEGKRDINNLKEEGDKVVIYVGEDPVIIIPGIIFPSFEETIEEVIGKSPLYDNKDRNNALEFLFNKFYLDIRAWSENNYDSQLLHFKMSFPLLKKLREVGETKFQIIFQQEILKSYATSTVKVKRFLEQEGYLKLISDFF